MPAFLAAIPVWILVLVGVLLTYAGYRYWQYKKANAYYTPKIANLDPLNFTSPRDNPAAGGG